MKKHIPEVRKIGRHLTRLADLMTGIRNAQSGARSPPLPRDEVLDVLRDEYKALQYLIGEIAKGVNKNENIKDRKNHTSR